MGFRPVYPPDTKCYIGCVKSEPIKVNLKFSFSFSKFSYSGLDTIFWSYFSVIADCQSLVCYKAHRSNSGFWTFFSVKYCSLDQQSRIGVIFLGFQNQGFPFPVSNTNWYSILFPGFQISDPKKAIFWFTLIGPKSPRDSISPIKPSMHGNECMILNSGI